MHLEHLTLRQFRNFTDAHIAFGPKFNFLVGRNAQGKTNIVEAVSLLATGRSFRTSEFRDLIRWGQEGSDVVARASGEKGGDDLRVSIDLSKKSFFRNEKKTTGGGFSGLGAVIFAPEEILLLRDSPSARRRYMDTLIAQVAPEGRSLVRRYERVVSHRNRLLQEIAERSLPPKEIVPWDDQLAELGAKIVLVRNRWCDRLNDALPEKYRAIAPSDGPAHFRYRPHCGGEEVAGGEAAVAAAIAVRMKERRDDELRRGVSLVGPHRDDFEAEIGGNAAKNFGSQGQHRSFVLALKITEAEVLKEAIGEPPILLLDDVASELDEDRNRYFFNYLRDAEGQVFVTATDEKGILIDGGSGARTFNIDSGLISERH